MSTEGRKSQTRQPARNRANDGRAPAGQIDGPADADRDDHGYQRSRDLAGDPARRQHDHDDTGRHQHICQMGAPEYAHRVPEPGRDLLPGRSDAEHVRELADGDLDTHPGQESHQHGAGKKFARTRAALPGPAAASPRPAGLRAQPAGRSPAIRAGPDRPARQRGSRRSRSRQPQRGAGTNPGQRTPPSAASSCTGRSPPASRRSSRDTRCRGRGSLAASGGHRRRVPRRSRRRLPEPKAGREVGHRGESFPAHPGGQPLGQYRGILRAVLPAAAGPGTARLTCSGG
jgi:hypothetical protein